MKRRRLRLSLALVLAAGSVSADEIALTHLPPAEAADRRLDLRVEQLRSEGGMTYATVTVRNNATFPLVKVSVECETLDREQRALDASERRIIASPDNPMEPGAAQTFVVAVAKPYARVRSMSCDAHAL